MQQPQSQAGPSRVQTWVMQPFIPSRPQPQLSFIPHGNISMPLTTSTALMVMTTNTPPLVPTPSTIHYISTQTSQFMRSRQKEADPASYTLYNQDFAGFSHQWIQAVFWSHTTSWRAGTKQKTIITRQHFTLTIHKQTRHIGCTVAKADKKQQEDATDKKHNIPLRHIPMMIAAILLLSCFIVGGTLIKQHRSAPMGSPCSAALCNTVVAVEEQCWHRMYRQLIFNGFYTCCTVLCHQIR